VISGKIPIQFIDLRLRFKIEFYSKRNVGISALKLFLQSSAVNVINVLRAHFSNEFLAPKITKLKHWLCNFLAPKYWQKNPHVKC